LDQYRQYFGLDPNEIRGSSDHLLASGDVDKATSTHSIDIPRANALDQIIADMLMELVDPKSLQFRLAGQMKAKLWKVNLINDLRDFPELYLLLNRII
jgi:hypothetical protein